MLKDKLKKENIPYDEVNPFEETIDNVEEYDPDQGEHIVNPSFITEEMATHFFSMFWGREDVYAKRGKNGGYFPQGDKREHIVFDQMLKPQKSIPFSVVNKQNIESKKKK